MKFKTGDKVTMKNDNGVIFHGKEIVKVDSSSTEPRYFITPTDTPWFSFHERNLEAA